MNKKGQEFITGMPIMFVGLMIAVMVLFAAVALLSPLKTIVDDARGPDYLNCVSDPNYNSSATSEELTCVAIDLMIPGFFVTVICVGLAWIGIKRVRRTEA